MSHFAQVKNNIVQQVIVAEQDFIDTLPDKEDWIQTSYNTLMGVHYTYDETTDTMIPSTDQSKALRYTYAGIGFIYDPIQDIFISPKTT